MAGPGETPVIAVSTETTPVVIRATAPAAEPTEIPLMEEKTEPVPADIDAGAEITTGIAEPPTRPAPTATPRPTPRGLGFFGKIHFFGKVAIGEFGVHVDPSLAPGPTILGMGRRAQRA